MQRTPQRDRESLYALGSWLARNLSGIKLEEKDMAPIEEGLGDALLERPLRVDPIVVGERVQTFLNRRRAQMAAEQKSADATLRRRGTRTNRARAKPWRL